MIHAILDTPEGFILATSDERGVLVLMRPMPPSLRDDVDGIRTFVQEGGTYIVAFADVPGSFFALRVPPGWNGEHIAREHVIPRAVAVEEVGDGMVSVACAIAEAFAAKAFASWQGEQEAREAALRAVLSRLPVGEA